MKILEPYRARIDALDDRIVDLLVERTGIIREVGHIKHEHGIPAVLQDRVDAVRERAAARAQAKGLDPELVRELYARLIAFSCSLEETIKDELTNSQAPDRP
ncbi:chorismate mutase [Pseudaminobacter sp. 19-2017]|uniref:chorismate mutase n=1 Tax=Pseudaminobacter soli (ex Zhang et al. 2022) TaxID=2831468 RepID=A0A942I451_9HYPH|nr:chorismate mutase [Pseudaminobacter soli]MBS3652322.1 chorismate mutase [Pseudaminobacter soli]